MPTPKVSKSNSRTIETNINVNQIDLCTDIQTVTSNFHKSTTKIVIAPEGNLQKYAMKKKVEEPKIELP